jgi:uncharacterized protein (TIGR03435 family)
LRTDGWIDSSTIVAAGLVAARVYLLFGSLTTPAAPQQTKRTFEVASVKPSDPKATGVTYTNHPGRVVFRNVTVWDLVVTAYRVNGERIDGLPEALKTAHYDIEGIAADRDDNRPPNTIRHQAELQALLEERFQLRSHRESRMLTVYELVRGDGALKLQPSAPEGRPHTDAKPGRVIFVHFWLNMFAAQLYTRLGRRRLVIDATGIDGPFDITVEFSPDSEDAANTVPPIDAFYRTIENLGLKLRTAKRPVEFLVIDHIERPAAN